MRPPVDDAIIHYGFPQNVWWPQYDKNFEGCHRYIMGRITDMDLALPHAGKKRIALQAGGHAGLWPIRLAKYFQQVITFEPEPVLFECLSRNIAATPSVAAHRAALGDEGKEIRMSLHGWSSGTCQVNEAGNIVVPQVTIDSLELPCLDALYLDVEAYEVQALRGAAKTIAAFRPVIHVELLPRSRDAIRGHLKSIGYREVARIHNDAVFVGRK